MKKIGILFGQETSFPEAFVSKINAMGLQDIQAEFVHIGVVKEAVPTGYSVIVDRISHDVPFYRSYLKNAVLTGTHVINNPFWWSADDKFFNYSLAARLGVAVPKTVILPHKQMPQDTNDISFRNQQYPYDWKSVFDYIGFPAFLKPHNGGGWRDVFHVESPEEFFHAYDGTRDLCMMLQAEVKFREYFRCYVVGQKEVRVMSYDPSRPPEARYVKNPPNYDPSLIERIEKNALTLCSALGYDLNTVEFGVEDGTPYAIDFMNPAPDADLDSVGQENFDWVVDAVARLAVKRAQANEGSCPEINAMGLLGSPMPRTVELKSKTAPKKSASKKASAKNATKKAESSKVAPKKQAANTVEADLEVGEQ